MPHNSHDSLFHYTINTTHGIYSPRLEGDGDVIEALLPVVHAGRGNILGCTFSLKLTRGMHSVLFDIQYGDSPIVTCGFATEKRGVSEFWPPLVSLAKDMKDKFVEMTGHSEIGDRILPVSHAPQELPLLAAFILPTAWLVAPPYGIQMAAKLERCIAWTVLEEASRG